MKNRLYKGLRKSDKEWELAFLESVEGKKAIITLHVEGIIDFIQQRAKEPL